jgi:hypothetical protein
VSDPQPQRRPTGAGLGEALTGGRLTRDQGDGTTFAQGNVPVMAPPPTHEKGWELLVLSPDQLLHLPATKAMDLMLDLSPDVSRAHWDFGRMCNPGFEVHARAPGADKEATDDVRAMAAIDLFFNTLRDLYGSLDVVIGRLYTNAMVRGAFFAELVLDPAGRLPIDLAIPDPAVVRFRRVDDPVRGGIWQAGQFINAAFVPYDRPTIRYIPIDPAPGSPYGRPMISPALFASTFLLGILHDLRRVIQEQGYPHRDISVKLDVLIANMPPDTQANEAAWQEWVKDAVKQVEDAVRRLKPEDTFVHTDSVEVNKAQGSADASSLGGVQNLMTFLEGWIARALKTTPLLMGIAEGTSEANANRQWEIYAAGIKAIQHFCEALLERLLEIALQAQGIVADVEFRFAELRTAELLRDAQVEQLQIANEREKFAAGWISQDEASEAITDHPAVETEPVDTPAPPAPIPDAALAQADPGSNRDVRALPPPVLVDVSKAPDAASKLWDETMPEAEGLLDADIEEGAA